MLCRTYRVISSSRVGAVRSPAPAEKEPTLGAASPLTPAPCGLNPSLPAERPAHPRAEHGLRPDQLTWAHQLEQAREEWRQHYVAIAQVRSTAQVRSIACSCRGRPPVRLRRCLGCGRSGG